MLNITCTLPCLIYLWQYGQTFLFLNACCLHIVHRRKIWPGWEDRVGCTFGESPHQSWMH